MQKLNITITLAIMLMIVGCKKTSSDLQVDSFDSSPITSQSAAKQVAYAATNLKKIGTEIAKLTKDPAFVSFVESQASKKFGGEYAVLIEKLIQNPVWSNKLNTQNLKEGLASFKNLNGRNFYPQIYIPKLLQDEENSINNFTSQTNNVGEDDSVKIVIYGGDSIPNNSSLIYPGYIVDTDGDLIDWGFINEEYANDHNVWVFSLNEVVDDQGRLMLPPCDPSDPDCTGSGGGGGGTPPAPSSIIGINDLSNGIGLNFRINKIKVKQHKENWLAGQSEVSINAWSNCRNGRVAGSASAPFQDYLTDVTYSDSKGILIKNVKRRDVKDQTEFTINYHLNTNWTVDNFNTKPIIFQYVIFEKDNWPTGERTRAHFPYNGESPYLNQSALFTFRSADDEYFLGSFYANKSGMTTNIISNTSNKTYTSNHFMLETRENNDGIKFNIANF